MRYHTGEKPFKCPHCDYVCREDTNLKLHVALHFSRRDFVCDVCGAAFHQKKTLERHVLYKHNDARNFSCAHCSQSFKTRYALSRHEQVHSSSRPFKCGTCNSAFKRMYNLRQHVKSVHSGTAAADDIDLFPPPRHVKVIDVPEDEAVKGNRRGRNPKPQIESYANELDNKMPQIQQFPAQDVWQKDTDTAGTLQLLLGTPMDQQDGTFSTPLLPQPTSTLNHDLLSRMVLPTSVPHIIEPQEQPQHLQHHHQQQQHQQQQQQQQPQHYLPLTDTTPQHAEPVLVDKQFQEATYPYYLLPSVNPQQT